MTGGEGYTVVEAFTLRRPGVDAVDGRVRGALGAGPMVRSVVSVCRCNNRAYSPRCVIFALEPVVGCETGAGRLCASVLLAGAGACWLPSRRRTNRLAPLGSSMATTSDAGRAEVTTGVPVPIRGVAVGADVLVDGELVRSAAGLRLSEAPRRVGGGGATVGALIATSIHKSLYKHRSSSNYLPVETIPRVASTPCGGLIPGARRISLSRIRRVAASTA